jgi:hypothetical protein
MLKMLIKAGKPADDLLTTGSAATTLADVMQLIDASVVLAHATAPTVTDLVMVAGATAADDVCVDNPVLHNHVISLGVPDLSSETRARILAITGDDDDTLSKYEALAVRKLRTLVKIIPEPLTDSALEAGILNSPLGQLRGGTDTYVMIFWDQKVAGESHGLPAYRPPPLRAERLRRVVSAMCSARGDANTINDGDLFFITDAWRHGNQQLIVNQFMDHTSTRPMAMKRNIKTLYMAYSETALEERNVRKGTSQWQDHVEFAYIITQNPLRLHKKARMNHEGSNTSGP